MLKQSIKVWPVVLAAVGMMASTMTGCTSLGDFGLDDTDFGWDDPKHGQDCVSSESINCLTADEDVSIERADTIDCTNCDGSYFYETRTIRVRIPLNGGYWEDRPQRIRLIVRNHQNVVLANYADVPVVWTNTDASAEPDGIGRWDFGGPDAIWYDDGEVGQVNVEFEAKGQVYGFGLTMPTSGSTD